MTAVDEIRALLDEHGPPAPTLLPWAARWAARGDLLLAARAAAGQAELTPFARWPVVADAVAEVLAVRARRNPPLARELIEILPPIAAHLPVIQIAALAEHGVDIDALGYAGLAHPSSRRLREVTEDSTRWPEVLRGFPVAPLASFRLLNRLVTWPPGPPDDLDGSEVVYLLPFQHDRPTGGVWAQRAFMEIVDSLATARAWYPAALLARAAPYLTRMQLEGIGGHAGVAASPWALLIRELAGRYRMPWPSAQAELAAAHPAAAPLASLSRVASRVELTVLVGQVVGSIFAESGGPVRWRAEVSRPEPSPMESLTSQERILSPGLRWADREPTVPLSTPEDDTGHGIADPAVRHVNVLLGLAGTDEAVPDQHVLAAEAHYELLVGIGRRVSASLLPGQQSRWPDELLPKAGLWLRAVLVLPSSSPPIVRPLFLPGKGESFTCNCPFDSAHEPGCEPRRWARFPVPAISQNGPLTGELVIYYGAAAVVAITLRITPGEPVRSGAKAALIGRLSDALDDLDPLAGRSASIVRSPGQNHLLVNGVTFLDSPLSLGALRADTVAMDARDALLDMHFVTRRGKRRSRLDDSFSKRHDDYEQDLRRLARLGADLFAALFNAPGSDEEAAYALPFLLRNEARVRNCPPVLQIFEGGFGECAIPWALVYDLPVGGDISSYVPCRSVREFGPARDPATGPPVTCPYPHDDRESVLCPYGFWGLSSVLEQPVVWSPEHVVCRDQLPLSWLVVSSPGRNDTTAIAHLEKLKESPAGVTVRQPVFGSTAQLADALAPESMDVVYFYCHCGYVTGHPETAADRYLQIGTFNVRPLDVHRWARLWRRVGPRPHWPTRRPLVILNGCHTAEFTSGTLNTFASAFVQNAHAAGVIGTEITVEEGLAGWVGEELLTLLAARLSVGEALHRLRWRMLQQGNVLGLAYTPFCLANLTLRPVDKD